jgi:3-hydroxyisobutyrate dehydrogenase
VLMMDAAVSASPQIVPTGNANLMVSAPAEVLERADPALRAITDKIFRCGSRVGDGQAMKTINNAMNAGNRLGMLEVLAFGRKVGLTLQAMVDSFSTGEAHCQISDRMLPALLQGKASTDFALSLMLKNIHQAISPGMKHICPMPITAVTQGLLQIGSNLQGPQARLEDTVKIIGSMANSSITGEVEEAAKYRLAETELAGMIDSLSSIVASQSRLISYECLAAGMKYGLELPEMREVLHSSSGWSTGSRNIFDELITGERSSSSSVDEAVTYLQEGCSLASRIGAPLMIANEARGTFERMRAQFGPGARVDEMSNLYPATAAT